MNNTVSVSTKYRECKKCHMVYTLDKKHFPKTSNTAFRRICCNCYSIRQKQYRNNNKDKIIEYKKKYEKQDYFKKYRENNKDKMKQYLKKYRKQKQKQHSSPEVSNVVKL